MAEIVNVVYTDSTGKEWPLQAEKLIRIKTANFHNWSYNPNTLSRRFGVRVVRFDKKPVAYNTKLYFGGNIEDRKTRIDTFHTAIEKDIRRNSPGKLTWGLYWISCFIDSSSTYPGDDDYTVNDIEVYCPYPFWIETTSYDFYKADDGETESEWLDYNYGYDYDYSPKEVGAAHVINKSPGDANFKMTIYGAAVNPYIYIGETRYAMNLTLIAGEYVVIDSQNKTVTRYSQNGTASNAYNDRDKTGESIFTPIPSGRQNVVWPATFGFSIEIYQERSEPAWT